ncbi:MAG TPA: 30S ribosomal protein S20 [Bacteroidia bacterium]|jgi:small subunit ribosomal protein S20|nr:30S ribosomal protein S20 [Bacteroidia bacterium]
MANHKSSIKRIRSNEAKRQRNRYQAKTVRTLIKEVRSKDKKADVVKDLPKVIASIDKLAKKNVFHKNKASNLKSKLMKKANKLAAGK